MAKKINKPKKESKRSLNPLRRQLDVLVKEANARVHRLVSRGMESRALTEANRTFRKLTSRESNGDLFKSNLKTRKEIIREFGRVNQFLSDYSSTVPGARAEANFAQDRLVGAFGGQWNELYGVNYDPNRIKEDIAQKAFKLYRQISEEFGGWERIAGIFKGRESLTSYGSEILINSIYDMLESGNSARVTMNLARGLVRDAEKRLDIMAKRQYLDEDYGILKGEEKRANQRRNYALWRVRNGFS